MDVRELKLDHNQQSSQLPPKNENKYNDLRIIVSASTHSLLQQQSYEYHEALGQKDQSKAKEIYDSTENMFSKPYLTKNNGSLVV